MACVTTVLECLDYFLKLVLSIEGWLPCSIKLENKLCKGMLANSRTLSRILVLDEELRFLL